MAEHPPEVRDDVKMATRTLAGDDFQPIFISWCACNIPERTIDMPSEFRLVRWEHLLAQAEVVFFNFLATSFSYSLLLLLSLAPVGLCDPRASGENDYYPHSLKALYTSSVPGVGLG